MPSDIVSYQFNLDSETATDHLGASIAAKVRPGTIIGLCGQLGAGKTRLVRAIATALGVDPDDISSPTYVLIHEYDGRLPIYHFDAYRLPHPHAFDELGAMEYLEGDGVCLIEWADRVADRLPSDAWWITLTPTCPNTRRVELRVPLHVAISLRDDAT
jgi:tRNA threonylcarbamoyladenosine biosynthesis protein TsaE